MRAGCLLALFILGSAVLAGEAPKYRSTAEILDAAPESAWRTPDPANILYMLLPGGIVIIELAPEFAPEHVANIRALALGHFWDGLPVYRVQDNFVAQFGDPAGEDPERARSLGEAKAKLPAEFHRDADGLAFTPLPDADGWAPEAGFSGSFPVARDQASGKAWLAHCYGMVGAGRGNDPDSSNGAELYVVIGQAPRQLDDNITLVGRVLGGMELLSGLKRGPPPMGYYQNGADLTTIRAVRLGTEVPEAARPKLQVLRTDTQTFLDTVEAQRNRVDEFYKRPAGHIDLCNVPLPVRAGP